MNAEFDRQLALARLRPEAVRPRDLVTIRAQLRRIVDLREPEVRRALGVELEDLVADNPAITRAIGEAAQHLGYEGVVAPSAAGGPGYVVAIFLTNRWSESLIEIIDTRPYEHL